MRDLLTFFGGVAVGVLAVTGVYALEEAESLSFVDCDDDDECDSNVKHSTEEPEEAAC
ncbi:hypothetical protein SYK_11940 [Pseudodesulfovibrio nedwellii]|uniref:Uncharacterized protein n=1 Tax=Pseudodesulfovibrio nedwellii TaxID=2973072 RepID=A0ABN6S0V3_9BACT|nr:hypothetical protein [Pseudodesulfovibrio nedwellii]BDQ36834.1 hypothetical protein SYK_11940 [Pseudodesulfovibrio nedwellii]